MAHRKPYIRVMPREHKGGGQVRFLAASEGYVMVRRPRCAPFIVKARDWNNWPLLEEY